MEISSRVFHLMTCNPLIGFVFNLGVKVPCEELDKRMKYTFRGKQNMYLLKLLFIHHY